MPHFKTGQTRHSRQIDTATIITNTGNQTYTVVAGTTHLSVEMWGAGGAGGAGVQGKGGAADSGGGGGAGAYTYIVLTENFRKNDTVSFTIGAGPAGASGANGSAGGNTTLNTYNGTATITYTNKAANGGEGGGRAAGAGGAGGTTSGGISPSANGGSGGNGVSSSSGCVSGGNGGVPPMVAAQSNNAGTCPSTKAESGSIAGRGGGGGLPLDGTDEGGDGANGKVVIKAYGYYPPVPVAP